MPSKSQFQKISQRGKLDAGRSFYPVEESELIVPHRINHDQYSRQTFLDIIMNFRVDNKTTIHETKEIQFWEAPDGSGAGCVSQLVHVTDSNKETGVGTKASTLLIASIKVINGRKVLVDLTEVLKTSA
jgi:hypothetical protein